MRCGPGCQGWWLTGQAQPLRHPSSTNAAGRVAHTLREHTTQDSAAMGGTSHSSRQCNKTASFYNIAVSSCGIFLLLPCLFLPSCHSPPTIADGVSVNSWRSLPSHSSTGTTRRPSPKHTPCCCCCIAAALPAWRPVKELLVLPGVGAGGSGLLVAYAPVGSTAHGHTHNGHLHIDTQPRSDGATRIAATGRSTARCRMHLSTMHAT